jgi:hypothetical protein
MGNLSVEHIDPRNGVLVSGLENEFNEIIADLSYNSKKVNRFVPYRVCDYAAPVNEGDVGEFLIGGDWVVCEFMVEDGVWWQESNRIGNCQVNGGKTAAAANFTTDICRSNGKANVAVMRAALTLEILKANGKKNATTYFTPEICSANGKANVAVMLAHPNTSSGRKIGNEKAAKKASKPVLCVETGAVYPSACEAARTTGLYQQNISSCCLGKRKTAGGLHWQFSS